MFTFPRRAVNWGPVWLLIGLLLAWKIIQTLLGDGQDIPVIPSEFMRPYNGGVE